jgi:hypothetical protein
MTLISDAISSCLIFSYPGHTDRCVGSTSKWLSKMCIIHTAYPYFSGSHSNHHTEVSSVHSNSLHIFLKLTIWITNSSSSLVHSKCRTDTLNVSQYCQFSNDKHNYLHMSEANILYFCYPFQNANISYMGWK